MAPASFARARDRVRATFWLVPTVCAVAAGVLATGLVAVDRLIGDVTSTFLFPGPPEGARSLLGAVISAMISFTGLVFSITVVVLVLTSGQFSPRILRSFLRDPVIQWTLGVFVATFVYAMTVIRAVLGTNGAGAFVPRIAVTVAFLLVLVSVGLFIGYISHVANIVRVSSIISSIGADSRRLLERRYPAEPGPSAAGGAPSGPAAVVANRRPGVLVSVHETAIAAEAVRTDRVLVLVPRVGDYVPAAAPLFRVYGPPPDDGFEHRLLERATLDDERTMEQDLAFGFRQLVDIAEKALSPAVNDPTTACQAIDVLHDLLRRLATRPAPSGRVGDRNGQLGLIVSRYEFTDLLRLAAAEIWHYGRSDVQVPDRLRTMLHDLDAAALAEHRSAVRHWLAEIGGGRPEAPE